MALAHEARKRYLFEKRGDDPTNGQKIRIALSLGPFGASLFPGQEFDGFYPPPYGPKAFSSDGQNCNAFGDDEEGHNKSIDALARFHFERLQIFSRDAEAWSAIDCIAFETVPLAREAKAIRKAVGMLRKESSASGERAISKKPWWISLVCPAGQYPESAWPGGPNLTIRQAAEATLGNASTANPSPDAIGINCTQTELLPALLEGLQVAAKDEGEQSGLWLVLYPNGGDVYDPVSRTWRVNEAIGSSENTWARALGKIVDSVRNQGVWKGVIVGGCCRVGPEEISALSRLVG